MVWCVWWCCSDGGDVVRWRRGDDAAWVMCGCLEHTYRRWMGMVSMRPMDIEGLAECSVEASLRRGTGTDMIWDAAGPNCIALARSPPARLWALSLLIAVSCRSPPSNAFQGPLSARRPVTFFDCDAIFTCASSHLSCATACTNRRTLPSPSSHAIPTKQTHARARGRAIGPYREGRAWETQMHGFCSDLGDGRQSRWSGAEGRGTRDAAVAPSLQHRWMGCWMSEWMLDE